MHARAEFATRRILQSMPIWQMQNLRAFLNGKIEFLSQMKIQF